MSGVIRLAGEERWQIGLARVEVSDTTVIVGEPIKGARALVWGLPTDRGRVEALYIDILDSKPFIPSFLSNDDGDEAEDDKPPDTQ